MSLGRRGGWGDIEEEEGGEDDVAEPSVDVWWCNTGFFSLIKEKLSPPEIIDPAVFSS